MRQNAPFIWIESQPVAFEGGLGVERAFKQGAPRRDGENRFYYLRRTFDLEGRADAARFALTTDGRYQLFVNGTFVGRGPARCDPLHKRVDIYDDLAPHLRPGRNVVALLVRCYGRDNAFYMTPPPSWREVFGDGGLWLDGDIRCGGATFSLRSDPMWRALRAAAWVEDTPMMNGSLGPIEWKDGALEPEGWTEPDFDDSAWESCRVLRVGGGGPEAPAGGKWIEPFPLLLPREIPFAAERDRLPQRLVWARPIESGSDLPIERRLYEEGLCAPDAALTGAAIGLTRGEAFFARTDTGKDIGLLLDFGEIHAGHPFVEIDAQGGEVIDIAVSERLPDEWKNGGKGDARIVPHKTWHGLGAHICRYVARPGLQRFERFDWAAVRYMQVAVRNAPGGAAIKVGSRETHYPVEARGAFSSSDPVLDRLWTLGANTLKACMHDAWVDCPSREQRQWLGDVAVEFPTALAAFGPGILPLNRQFLRHVAESQHGDGLTEMFAPGDHGHGLLRIPDWSLMWVLTAHAHWQLSGDFDTPRALLPSLERVLDWFAGFRGKSGLIADLPYWRFIDWAGVGRDGESATLNALYVAACRAVSAVCAENEDLGRARQWREEGDRVATLLAERHWDAERGVYVDMVDPASGGQDPRVSQHANMSLILWDIAPPQRWDSMIAWCTDPARVKVTKAPRIVTRGETIDPASDCVAANTFFAHFVSEALQKAGRPDLAVADLRRRYAPMVAAGATTLWESYSDEASLCHGFSAAPLWQMAATILGVRPSRPGYRSIAFAPDLVDLEHARGTVPTPFGDVHVSLSRDGETVLAEIRAPHDVEVVPTGTRRFRFGGDPVQDGASLRYRLLPNANHLSGQSEPSPPPKASIPCPLPNPF